MTQTGPSQTPRPNPLLARLEVFAGDWDMQSPQYPDARGRVSFTWMEDNAFLVERTGLPTALPPSSIQVIGPDDSQEQYDVLYHDARGVSRIYHMSLEGSEWKLWRSAPGFSQRFFGTFSPDRNTISAHWETSEDDGATWKLDFDLVYTRVH